MKSQFLSSVAVVLAVGMSVPALAARADRRGAHQQQRIEKGLQSGQLTGREAAKVERREGKIDQQVAADRAANGGKLTPEERQQVNREQNRVSRNIYNQKHDGQTAMGAKKMGVNAREDRQQDRIQQGLASGQLTGKEATHLEKREAKIDSKVAAERAANGGTLTPAERAKAEHQQDRASKAIYVQKHDGQIQP